MDFLLAAFLLAAGSWPPAKYARPWDVGRDIVWHNTGPGGGGWIQSIAADPIRPNVLHVGCDVGGYYVSYDGGRSFEIRNRGLVDYYIDAIAVHPRDPRIIILGARSGIHKTTDGGRTWRWIRNGFPPIKRYAYTAPIAAVCFDPTNPNIVYAGVGQPREYRFGVGQIYKSRDCGETWQLSNAGLPADAIVSDIEVRPDKPNVILAATSRGVFRSEDAGATWQLSSTGLRHHDVYRLAMAPSNPDVVYCTLRTHARDNQPWDGGVYRSDDGGRTWRARNGGLPKRVARSDQPAPMGSRYHEIVVDPRNPDVAYVGGDAWVTSGVYKTTDGGLHWTWCSRHVDRPNGPKNMDRGWISFWGPGVKCMTISPVQPDRLWFGTSGHVYGTANGGKTWQQFYCRQLPDGRFHGNGLEVTCMFNIVPDPYRRGRVFFCFADIGLLISEDGGKTFRRSWRGMKNFGNCFTVVVDPANPDRIWAATGQWARNVGDVCRSDDGGKTWRVVGHPLTGLPVGQTKILLLDPTSPTNARRLLVSCRGAGIFESTDGGETWHSINGNLPPQAARDPRGLLIDPANSKHLIAALGGTPSTGAGVYETRDGGRTWQKISQSDELADIQALVASPHDFHTLYIAQRQHYDRTVKPPVRRPGGLFVSHDGGRTWQRIFSDHFFVRCVLPSPLDPKVIYIGTTDHPYHDRSLPPGLLKSEEGGRTWHLENHGLTCLKIAAIAADPQKPWQLYVGSSGNAAFIGVDEQVRRKYEKGPKR